MYQIASYRPVLPLGYTGMKKSRRPVKEPTASGPKLAKSYHVSRAGTRGEAKSALDQPEQSSTNIPMHFHEPQAHLDVLMEQIELEFARDQLADHPPTPSIPVDPELDALMAEFKERLEDSAESPVKPAPSGKTNNVEPHYHPDRLRELLRTTREWDHLQLLKRAGKVNRISKELGALAIRCPACPRRDVNYIPEDVTLGLEYPFAYLISYDGSFQLTRKNKAFDQYDTCTSDGLLYWVQQESYAAHLLANKDTAYNQSTKGERCNNHRAANDAWVKQSGVAETGVGAVTCARHTFFMPQGCVNYWKGERYSYTDYAIASVIFLLMNEGTTEIGVFYNIFCQWHKNFWARAPGIVLPEGKLSQPDRFFGGIPKYHLAGHIDSCYAQYSLNNMHGVGRLDAEGCERGWANLNGASGSTSEKGPGSRIDSLNHCMNDWNWRKLVSMINNIITVTFLLKALSTAVRLAAEQEDAWLGFHHAQNETLTAQWAEMSTAPRFENGTWTSVFLMNSATVTSRLRTVLDLNMRESARIIDSETVELGYTAPTWLSEGLDIERIQMKLCIDIKEYGSPMTQRQWTDVDNRRMALSTRLTSHRNSAALFIDLMLTSVGLLPSLAEETDGHPEHASLYMPSHLMDCPPRAKDKGKPSKNTARVPNTETKLPLVQLDLTERSTRVVQLEVEAMNDYNHSFRALCNLGVSSTDIKPFQLMHSTDMKGLNTILKGERTLGEKDRKLPWFWRVKHHDGGNGDEEDEEEFVEAIHVEWFRGRERFRRWREEVLWLRRELASTLFDYHHRVGNIGLV
ncbi:hypothetical protein RSAG8_13130, partial [Rhizoctonia solani AG-8 WAC10335]